MAGKVSSKDPRVQAAIEARRSREAARKSSKSDKKQTKKKVASLGSGMAERARKLLSGRSRQINKAVDKAVKGK